MNRMCSSLISSLTLLALAAAACGPAGPATVSATESPTATAPVPTPTQKYEIVTLLPRDAIPAVDNPKFYSVAEADAEYAPDELVLGLTIDGESRAYSTSYLDTHEIVNDTVGGRKIAVTW